jgi:Ser/Thr protein kinase RdoA (MazF antagonist)
MNNLKDIVSKFKIEGTVKEVKPLGTGLINDTYKVTTNENDAPDYVLQRINNAIFQDVDMLQSNIMAVTNHIRRKLEAAGEDDIDRKVLRFIETVDGKTYWFDGENYWRISVFIPRAKTYEAVNPEYSYYAGVAFGDFQSKLADIPDKLGETIPDFHNMEFRLKQLHEAVANNAAGRVAEVKYYLDEIEKRAEEMCKAERLYREGKLPKRICHCDTKVNNMMFDEDGKVLCVIDLDTVMPSFIFSDYGDFLRTAANTGDEDDKDLNNVNFNMEIFKAFTKGYLESAKSFLTPIEIENLPYAATLFPYMQCVRFLADYINGDTYYKIKYPEHNLVRTKAQFKLLQSAEQCIPEMKAFIKECLSK